MPYNSTQTESQTAAATRFSAASRPLPAIAAGRSALMCRRAAEAPDVHRGCQSHFSVSELHVGALFAVPACPQRDRVRCFISQRCARGMLTDARQKPPLEFRLIPCQPFCHQLTSTLCDATTERSAPPPTARRLHRPVRWRSAPPPRPPSPLSG